MISLAEVRGRDNNFNLLRVIAAFAVLYVHSRALTTRGTCDLLPGLRNFSSGAIALDLLFFTSGFLITASLISRGDLIDYAWARAMRVFPGLWLNLLLVVPALGLFIGTLPASDFFASPVTHDYVLRTGTLINGVRFALPGVFTNNPVPGVVNGSLWTLPIEWRLYEYLAGGWLLFALKPAWRQKVFRYGLPAAAFALTAIALKTFYLTGERDTVLVPQAMFFCGGALQMWRAHIRLSYLRLAALLAVVALATLRLDVFFPIYLLTLGPIALHFVYLFGGPLRAYNRLGDYSYGVYIYSFPIQQSFIALHPGIAASTLDLYAATLSLACAIFSWHVVEKRALGWKSIPAAATERLFERLRGGLADWRSRRTA
ncbi:MAG TPA: acyltransferase [Rhodoblastus sp.]|nr:acyltransferase [Rhodoblastus sp.]